MRQNNKNGRAKGQTLEILNFLALAIVVIGVILAMRSMGASSNLKSGQAATEYHQSQSFHSAVNAFISTVNSDSGRNMLELLSLVSSQNKEVLKLGRSGHKVTINATAEFKQRLDKLLGQGNWQLTIPIAKKSRIHLVMVVDTSTSLCDDIEQLQTGLPILVKSMEQEGKDVKIDIYLLPSEGNCPSGFSDIACDNFPSSQSIDCKSLKEADCSLSNQQSEEDWGNGLKCVIDSKADDWPDSSVLLGVPLSDEMPAGCECGSDSCLNYNEGINTGSHNCWSGGHMSSDSGCTTQQESLNNGIEAAKNEGMILFPLKANPCATPSHNCPDGPVYTCANDKILGEYMRKAADQTGGKMYSIQDASKTSQRIREMLASYQGEKIPPIEIGSQPPSKGKTSYQIPVPVMQGGKVVFAKLDWWS